MRAYVDRWPIPPSTMAHPAAAAPSRGTPQARNAPPNAPPPSVKKSFVKRDLDLTLRAFFFFSPEPKKFNPAVAMKQLFHAMIKDKPSLVLRTASNDNQIDLVSAQIPTGEN